MKNSLLAIDTSTPHLSVALKPEEGEVVTEISERPLSHNEEIVRLCSELLMRAKVELSDLKMVVLGSGPGSFTGLRIGYSFVQGLCSSLQIPALTPSSFCAAALLAAERNSNKSEVVVVSKANRREVYQAHFTRKQSNQEWWSIRPELVSYEQFLSSRPNLSNTLTVPLSEEVLETLKGGGVEDDGVALVGDVARGLLLAPVPEVRFSVKDLTNMSPDYVQPVAAKPLSERQ